MSHDLSKIYKFRRTYRSQGILTAIAVATIPAMLQSCSDEDLTTGKADSRVIRFDVSTRQAPEASSRSSLSSLSSGRPDVRPFEGDNGLYLVTRTEPGMSQSESTRSVTVDSETISSMGVFAGYASEAGSSTYIPDYMQNVEVTKANSWIPTEEYLWPGSGALHFNAYSPFFDGSEDANEGITGVTAENGTVNLSYTVPASVDNQIDLLYATPIDASASPCNLTFNHALTGIRFATGAEMAPCTVKSITISGAAVSGTLNLETGQWTLDDSVSDYTVTPEIQLTAAEGSKFVASSTPITSDDQTLLLLPQTVGEGVTLSITLKTGGKETVLTTSLSGQEWEQGKTVTYRISANPAADSLTLEVTGDFQTKYTGSTTSFSVVSSQYADGASSDVAWIAEFVDDEGNVIARPNWIDSITTKGNGTMTGEIITEMQDIEFLNMSSGTRILQNASDINSSSGQTPYNLSSSTGGATVENSANSYIVNAPGQYSLPLVYGNAIKNGATNQASYVSTSRNSKALKTFTNHLGNAISAPYIPDNTGCTPASASLLWEDELNLVRNVRLSDDKRSLIFDVPQNTIRQGNALVAVKDGDGNVMWSWQIWVTNFNPSSDSVNIAVSGTTYSLWTQNLGYVEGGDETLFPESKVKIRFTQTGLPEGSEPLSQTVELVQSSAQFETPYSNPFYQWGRKDPMMPAVDQWYDGSHNEITALNVKSAVGIATTDLIENFILYPQTFFTGSHESTNPTSYPYLNLWNINYSATNVKSIYDPSPAGYVIPYSQPFTYMGTLTSDKTANTNVSVVKNSDATDPGYTVTLLTGGQTIHFTDFGYRSGQSGATVGFGVDTNLWTSHAVNVTTGGIFNLSENTSGSQPLAKTTTDPFFHGFAVRPIKE